MANITLTSADLLIPEVWANEGIRALRRKIRLARVVTRDSDYGTFNEGDKLNIPLPPSFVVNTKTAGGAVTLQQPTDSTISVTLNQHKEVSFLLEDAVKAMRGGPGAGQTGIERYMNAAIEPIALAIEDALWALYAGFSTTVGTSGTDITSATLRSVAKSFNDASIPEENRNIFVATKDYAALQADTSLAAFFANATPEAIKTGVLTNIAGLNIGWSNRVPVVAGSPDSTKNIALAPRRDDPRHAEPPHRRQHDGRPADRHGRPGVRPQHPRHDGLQPDLPRHAGHPRCPLRSRRGPRRLRYHRPLVRASTPRRSRRRRRPRGGAGGTR